MKQFRPRPEVRFRVAGVFIALLLPTLLASPQLARGTTPLPGQDTSTAEKAPPPPVVEYSAGLLSVTAKSAEVRTVVDAIAAKSGIEIVLDEAVTGKVTAEFKGVKFEEGLKALLNDVVEGGFSSEYVKAAGDKGEVLLRKVRIARIGKEAMQRKDVLRITDITVQDAVGEEIVFAKWGNGKDEIPQSRNGFSIMRVSDDGTIYFVGDSLRRIYVYSPNGQPMKPVDKPQEMERAQSFEVDHEGNVYFLDANRNGPTSIGTVYVCRRDGTYLGKVSIPATQAEFTPHAFIEDGILRDAYRTEPVYDFRKYLVNSARHSARKRYIPMGMFLSGFDSLGESDNAGESVVFSIRDTREMELEDGLFLAPYPFSEWPRAESGPEPLGYDRWNRFYYHFGIRKSYPYRFYDDHGIGLFDPKRRSAWYFRLKELDSHVFEHGYSATPRRNFDVDLEGNVFFLFTTKDGVHVYRYALGRMGA